MPGNLGPVAQPVRDIDQRFAAASSEAAMAAISRDDLVLETPPELIGGASVFRQQEGPFRHYERTVTVMVDGTVAQRTSFRLDIPWFGWLFRPIVARRLAARPPNGTPLPWWSPPDRLTARQVHLLGILAMASLSAVFTNTLFTQTATFTKATFGVDESDLGWAGTAVRLGIVVALPFTILADRVGRRKMLVASAWLAPLCCALGAVAPSFPLLVATQAVGRPIGIALALLIGVVVSEEVPRNSRAFALSLMTMAGGLGATVAVANLWVADLSRDSWRLIYLLSLVWVVVAVSVQRHLPETERFETMVETSSTIPSLRWRRFALIASVSTLANLFVAPASYYQNDYLRENRGMSGAMISLFTIVTATPAGLGLAFGGRLADAVGRRVVLIACMPLSTFLLAISFAVDGVTMWLTALTGAVLGALAYPAFTVYRAEMFPTGNRGRANGFIQALALAGGAGGLVMVGSLVDRGTSYGVAMLAVGVGQLVAALLAFSLYPETAHRDLEALNPEDAAPTPR
jgi:MFS family permease